AGIRNCARVLVYAVELNLRLMAYGKVFINISTRATGYVQHLQRTRRVREASIQYLMKVGLAVSHCVNGRKRMKVAIPIGEMLFRSYVATVQLVNDFVVARISMRLQKGESLQGRRGRGFAKSVLQLGDVVARQLPFFSQPSNLIDPRTEQFVVGFIRAALGY